MKCKKKPVVVEAIKFTKDNTKECILFMNNQRIGSCTPGERIEIMTLEGSMRASVSDYIIKGVQGEFYPCKPDIFEQTYEIVGE